MRVPFRQLKTQEERRGRNTARPALAGCLRPSPGWRRAGLLRNSRCRARRAIRAQGQGGLGLLSAAIVVTCLLTGRLNGAVLAAAAVPVAVGLNDGLLKPLIHRTYLDNVVYPSGHTTAVFALAATATVLLAIPAQPGRARALRALIPAAASILGGVVAIAVIGLRWHYFTDTVAGVAVGTGTVCGLVLILDLPAARRWLAWASH